METAHQTLLNDMLLASIGLIHMEKRRSIPHMILVFLAKIVHPNASIFSTTLHALLAIDMPLESHHPELQCHDISLVESYMILSKELVKHFL
jgi:hypothetical protein